jgi:hypothetical protein
MKVKLPRYVYFARRADAVKIGVSSNPYARGALFGEVVHIEAGGYQREHELHRQFAHLLRTRPCSETKSGLTMDPPPGAPLEGSFEWFRLEGALAEYLAPHVRGAPHRDAAKSQVSGVAQGTPPPPTEPHVPRRDAAACNLGLTTASPGHGGTLDQGRFRLPGRDSR